jgi:DNA modification methylase
LAMAKTYGRSSIGIELNPKYIKHAERRLAAIPQSLFQS